MLKVFISSTSRDLKEFREVLLDEVGKALDGIGMEFFVPRGEGSQKDSIDYLKSCQVVIFLITPYYGSLMEKCTLKENCKALDCPMKTDKGRISFTHCEYKTTIAEDIRHQTYLIEKDWELIDYLKKLPENEFNAGKIKELEMFADVPLQLVEKYYKVSKPADLLRTEVSSEAYGRIESILIPETVDLIKKTLADQIIKWHTYDKLNFKKFVGREAVLNEIIDNIDSKVEVWGVGGVGKTALVEVALLVQKLKGRKILTIGTTKTYTSGSGLEYFSNKRADDQYITDSKNKITIYDVINAFVENGLFLNAEEVNKLPKDKQIEILSQKIRSEQDLILFIDDFHLATEDVLNLVKSVDHLILSSRKNMGIARKEIYLSGIDDKDREDLIKLFLTEIPQNIMELISKIAEGHPVSTELLVKNYEKINFDKIKDFNLKEADDNQVKDFYDRVLEEIFSNNPQALSLLKDLAVLNTDLPSNINRDSMINSYNIEKMGKIFNYLVDTGMVIKKEGKQGTYEFYFKHIQDYLEDIAKKESHEKAIEYYGKKGEKFGEFIDDAVEVLYHKVKSNPTGELVDEILNINKKIQPVQCGFKRLINVGEEFKTLVGEEYKAPILVVLGKSYWHLKRFAEAEQAYTEALGIYKKFADQNPDVYNPDVALTQNNLGTLYADLNRFEEAEQAYTEALDIYKKFAYQNPDAYNSYVATAQNNLGVLYVNLNRFEEAKHAYTEALEIRKKLVEQNPDAYTPAVAMTQNNLGVLYDDLKRFEEAEQAYTEALEIYKELAEQNPYAYNYYVASTQNNLGALYDNLNRFEEAEHAYIKALEIWKKLVDKNPDAYFPDVAQTQFNLGILYGKSRRFEQAEHAFKEALEINKKEAEKNPDAYTPGVVMTQNNLGILYVIQQNYENAEKSFKEVLKVYEQLAEKYPQVYLSKFIRTLRNLRDLYKDTKRRKEAKKIAKKIEELEKKKA